MTTTQTTETITPPKELQVFFKWKYEFLSENQEVDPELDEE
jgi:hypothetical protein